METAHDRRKKDIDFHLMQKDVQEIKAAVHELTTVITGDLKNPGLCTQVVINRNGIKRQQWWNRAIAMGIILGGIKIAFDAIREVLR